jgi:transcriptional regulator with GAF, ATPase, and Fis domain
LVENRLQDALYQVEELKNKLQAENMYLQEEIKLNSNFEEIIGKSKQVREVLNKVEQVAPTDSTVLVLGETGTGKELIARAIHGISKRKHRPLVKVNCAALPPNLIESELFGHERGAFTGAISRKIGRFELADGGTLFLDEVGDLPLELQVKLLRVLQEGEFERVGSSRTISIDVRIIAATNREIEKAIEVGKFREDLFYRLNVYPIEVPPLRERRDDIPLLINHFVNKISKRLGKTITKIPQSAIDSLMKFSWPGNVRSLENVIERSIITTQGDTLELDGSSLVVIDNKGNKLKKATLEEVEREHITSILESTNWRVSGPKGAAKILGINSNTLVSRMRKLRIKRP